MSDLRLDATPARPLDYLLQFAQTMLGGEVVFVLVVGGRPRGIASGPTWEWVGRRAGAADSAPSRLGHRAEVADRPWFSMV